MESGRFPLVGKFRPSGGDFQGIWVFRSDVVLGGARKVSSALLIIVSMSPPGYPSAWFRPRRARFRFAWQDYWSADEACGLNFRLARYWDTIAKVPEMTTSLDGRTV